MPRLLLAGGAAMLMTLCPWLVVLAFPACRAGTLTRCVAFHAPGSRYACPRDFATEATVRVVPHGSGLALCRHCGKHGVSAGDAPTCHLCPVPWESAPQCANFFSGLYAEECTRGVVRNVRGRWLRCAV